MTKDLQHRDETGNPCTQHALSDEALLAWAALGARISGFHHDSASKLQSLMMALDEATDLLGDERPDVKRSLDSATEALRELHGLLSENRALAKAPQRKITPLADVLDRAANRHGVKLSGDLGTATVAIAPPSIVHALALLIDHAAGAAQGSRVVGVTVRATDEAVTLELAATPGDKPARTLNETLAVAAFLLVREDGSLACSPRGFVVQLPTRLRSAGVKP